MSSLLHFEKKKVLILAKTYPCPSEKYIETCCTAGITIDGEPIRLYPVPFRQLSDERKYAKWQWISAPVTKSNSDNRKESFKINFLEISPEEKVPPKNHWLERIPWIEKLPKYNDLDKLKEDGKQGLCSLAYIKVDSLEDFIISPAKQSKYSEDELRKLASQSKDLFSDLGELKEITTILQKIPFDFYYKFKVNQKTFKAKIIDWEICQLYRKCVKESDWEAKVRKKYFDTFRSYDLYLILGNMMRFRNQFLIISVCAIPKKEERVEDRNQPSLF